MSSRRLARIEVPEGRAFTPGDEVPPVPSARPHFYRIVASNGETLLHSETYTNRAEAFRAVGDFWEAIYQMIDAGLAPERKAH